MTLEELTKLDNYGHMQLKVLNEAQLKEYATLLEMRRKEVEQLRKRHGNLSAKGEGD